MRVVVRGAGDLATGVGMRLRRAGFEVILCEREIPTAIRRTVCMSEAVRNGEAWVEDIRGVLCKNDAAVERALADGDIAVVVDAEARCAARLKPDALVDAIIAKRNTGARKDMAPIVIGMGPGFVTGVDCHAVVETMRGHDLGRVFYPDGSRAKADTGVPGDIGGYTHERVMHAPRAGTYEAVREIGDMVAAGDAVAYVDGAPVKAKIAGVLRGQLPNGIAVSEGMKCADVDPRGEKQYCFSVTDKARSLGGAVLEAILHLHGQIVK